MKEYLRTLHLRRMYAADGAAHGRMHLQLFAGEGSEGGNGSNGNADENGSAGNDGNGSNSGESRKGEKLLTPAEVNRIVQKTIAEERSRFKRETELNRSGDPCGQESARIPA